MYSSIQQHIRRSRCLKGKCNSEVKTQGVEMPKPDFVAWLIAGTMVVVAGAVTGQPYPTKPIRIVTAPAGAGNDFMARVIAQGLTGSLGQQLVVDNRPAAILGELVAKAPA